MLKKQQFLVHLIYSICLLVLLNLAGCDRLSGDGKSEKSNAGKATITKTPYQQNKEKDALDERPIYERLLEGIGKEKTVLLYEQLGQDQMDLLSYGAGVSNVIALVNIISDVNKLVALVGNDYVIPATGLGAVRIIALLNTIDSEMQQNRYNGMPPANQDTISRLAALVNGLSQSALTSKVVAMINSMGITRGMGSPSDQSSIQKLSRLVAHVGNIQKVITILNNLSISDVTVKLKDILLGVSDVGKMVEVVDRVADSAKLVSLIGGITSAAKLIIILNQVTQVSVSKLGVLVNEITNTSALVFLINNIGDAQKMADLINEMEDGSTWTGQNGSPQTWIGSLTLDHGIDRLKSIMNTLSSGTESETTANINKLVLVLNGTADMTKFMRIIQDLTDKSDIITVILNLTDPALNAEPSQNLGYILENTALGNIPRMVTMVNGKRSVSPASQSTYLSKLDTVLEGITQAAESPDKVAVLINNISNPGKIVDLIHEVNNPSYLVNVINGINPSSSASPNNTAVTTLVTILENVASVSKLVTVINTVNDVNKIVALVNYVSAGSQQADDGSVDLNAAGKKLKTIIEDVNDPAKLVSVLDGANIVKMSALLNDLKIANSAKIVLLVNDILTMSKLVTLVNQVTNMSDMATMVNTVIDASQLVKMVNGVIDANNLASLVNAVIADPITGIADVVDFLNNMNPDDMGKLTTLVNTLNGAKDALIASLMGPYSGASQGIGTAELVTLISGLSNSTIAANLATLMLSINPTLNYLGTQISQKEGLVRLLKAGVTYQSVDFPGIGGWHVATMMNNIKNVTDLIALLNSIGIEQMAPIVGCLDHVSGFETACAYIGQGWSSQNLKIAAFNIQIFGVTKMSKPGIPEIIVNIIRRYDLILIQEIRDSTDTSINTLLSMVNNNISPAYQMTLSNRLGRTSSKEQYAYIYNPSKLTLLDAYHYPEPNGDVFSREPYIPRFRTNTGFDFAVIGAHLAASSAETRAELNALVSVYEDVVSRWGETDVMLMGDFNADCTYVSASAYNALLLVNDNRFKWWIDSAADTTATTTSCAYDRFISTGGVTSRVAPNTAVAYRYDAEFGLDSTTTLAVSDHYPIEIEMVP